MTYTRVGKVLYILDAEAKGLWACGPGGPMGWEAIEFTTCLTDSV